MSQKSILILLWGLVAIAIIMLTAFLVIACAKPDPSEQPKKKRQTHVSMTYRDLVGIQHPDMIRPDELGGVHGCPACYGYEHHIREACPLRDDWQKPTWEAQNRSCHACWNREVPEEELHELMEVETA